MQNEKVVLSLMNQKGNIMILTQEQQLVSNDLLNFIKLKNLKIESPEDLKDAFRDYLINGSVSHWFFQKADEVQKKQFIKEIAKQAE